MVFTDSKPHFELLDGLRGVAALLVVWYHVYEGFAFAAGEAVIGGLNHGYLAVDFFFILSGFVIGYAYDDRWAEKLTLGGFIRRRITRLHPMVVMGAVIGCLTYWLQGGTTWSGTHMPLSAIVTAFLMALFLLPMHPSCPADVRGNGEAFPLNGPAWSLFFEYIGNLLYALALRRLRTWQLGVVTLVLEVGMCAFTWLDAAGYGNFGVGWTIGGIGFWSGLLRMSFPFTMGLLLSRLFRPWRMRGAFWFCSLWLLGVLAVPPILQTSPVLWNGVYESVCIGIVFPLLVWLGASGRTTDRFTSWFCRFAGNLSYPLYIIHYPFMYLFYHWMMVSGRHDLSSTWWVVCGVCLWNVLAAYLCWRFYDLPLRRWLANRKL